ncbi:sensor histidine kinase [Lysobacter solisilvae (ex Woo and Kim 2020)]|uniref:histidine kinase n=1 Tax=Agrilutibacter terrestris TaxID=2865112 RepID=A0A7H0G0K0_9GAMM|nr:HAMP domain-containing sensor histidine kinase [Lysobacter terrestris]QNP41816.1 HAMP domain-containing histidine kinase [Lysobacter terrestris]
MNATTPRRVRGRSLRSRILLALLGYVVLLSLVVIAQGNLVHERAERLVWRTMLNSELDHVVERLRDQPGYRWTNTNTMALYDARDATLPAPLRTIGPGLHDDIDIGGRYYVVLVRRVDARTLLLTLDVTDFEQREVHTAVNVVGVALGLIVVLGLIVAWIANRMVRPLSRMAEQIGDLRPDLPAQRIDVRESASSELHVIADALNDYLQRNARFVERERTFIDTASHELRTPIAVISGSAELALQQPGLPAPTQQQLGRIRRTARDVEQLISLLLVLAKDPARLARASERVALDQLLPAIVEDHRHLTRDKALTLALAPLPQVEISAPLPIVQAAIGNLLRNAIEHSDRGEIRVRLLAPATVVIDDPGHGMTPEEISAIYARMARGGNGDRGDGIGLDLISRLCEHLGWRLSLASDQGRGTTTTLSFTNT